MMDFKDLSLTRSLDPKRTLVREGRSDAAQRQIFEVPHNDVAQRLIFEVPQFILRWSSSL
jgi:hypothetical protein